MLGCAGLCQKSDDPDDMSEAASKPRETPSCRPLSVLLQLCISAGQNGTTYRAGA